MRILLISTHGVSLETTMEQYARMGDILMDNPFGYDSEFICYKTDVNAEDWAVRGDIYKDVIAQLGQWGFHDWTPLLMNGVPVAYGTLKDFIPFVAEDRAIWVKHTVQPAVYVPMEDTEPHGVIDNTNDDSYDGSW
jgi:hypothetical protein